MRSLGTLLLLTSLLHAAEGPVAVMPFRNLNRAPRLAWLEVGMAETMIADLRRAHVTVVERGQLDRAMSELSLQQSSAVDTATAVRLGKLLGARSLVVGAFQEAGREVRISARFVAVESGEVREAAAVTGPLERIFALQDEVVEKLLGKPRPKRKIGPRAVEAYELYSRSLVAQNDDDRKSLLVQSLAVEPGFVYAADDLAALEKRMAGYARVATTRLAERERLLLSKVEDPKLALDERRRLAGELLESLVASRRWHTLAQLTLPPLRSETLDEQASWRRFCALDKVHRGDAALAAGERHLKTFPTGAHYRDVETRMHELAEAKKKMAARRAEYDADLKEKRAGLGPGVEWDFAPCIAARWNSQVNDLMLDQCSAFLARHAKDPDKDTRDHVIAARYFVILALDARGDFERARPLAEQLIADSDEWDEELRKLMAEWPQD